MCTGGRNYVNRCEPWFVPTESLRPPVLRESCGCSWTDPRVTSSSIPLCITGWGGFLLGKKFATRNSHKKFSALFFFFFRKPTKSFRRRICHAQNIRRLWRHFFHFLWISLWIPKKPTNFFRCVNLSPEFFFFFFLAMNPWNSQPIVGRVTI